MEIGTQQSAINGLIDLWEDICFVQGKGFMARQLKAVDREQHQLLQWALKDFPADQVEAENRRLNKAKETLKAQRIELEVQLKASQEAVINVPNLERFIADMQKRLPELDFEGKRLALDMLGITVWLDGESIEVTGIIDTKSCIVLTPLSAGYSPLGDLKSPLVPLYERGKLGWGNTKGISL